MGNLGRSATSESSKYLGSSKVLRPSFEVSERRLDIVPEINL